MKKVKRAKSTGTSLTSTENFNKHIAKNLLIGRRRRLFMVTDDELDILKANLVELRSNEVAKAA